MKTPNENLKYTISEGIALLFGILALAFTFLPAYFEQNRPDLSLFQIMLGDGRVGASPLLIFGFVLLIVGIITTLILLALLVLKKSNDIITTVMSVLSIVCTLGGAIILSCGIFISGLDKFNSELGFTQGYWGFKIGNILVPVAALLSVIASYPSAMIILHHKDLIDQQKRQGKVTSSK